ncbi:MAG TPA: S8 family serine peptidase, partial [Blastocatellia bacterium]|nr:S8 family serine peptidase [Blastocatellia bacterium]
MNRLRRSPILAWLTGFTLGLMFISGLSPLGAVNAQVDQGKRQNEETPVSRSMEDLSTSEKVSPDLKEMATAPEMQASAKLSPKSIVRVLVQLKGKPRATLNALLSSAEVKVKRSYPNFNSRLVELPLGTVNEIASYKEVAYVSLDRDAQMLGHIEKTTGAEEMRKVSGNKDFDGRGIGIAVLDSSIFNTHRSFLGDDGKNRVVVDVDFTGMGMNADDPYGHGTHVASIAAGGDKD